MWRMLDHIVIAGHDLAALSDFYARLGFQVGRRNIHPWGTENHIVQFDGVFLELLGLPSDGRALAEPAPYFAEFVRDYLAKREGLAMLVLASRDAPADYADFKVQNIGGAPLFDFARTGRRPDGSEVKLAFTLVFAQPAEPMDCGFFTCQQHFPQNFWNKDFQRHENGALALAEVLFVSESPLRDAAFFESFAGVAANNTHAGLSVFGDAHQRLVVAQADVLAREYGINLPQGRTSMTGLHFQVRNLADFTLHLQKQAIVWSAYKNYIFIAPEAAFGAFLIFHRYNFYALQARECVNVAKYMDFGWLSALFSKNKS